MIRVFLFYFMLLTFNSSAADIPYTLYLNRDTVEMSSLLVNRCVYNETSTFSKKNAIIDINQGDNLILTIHNNDTIEHTPRILNGAELGVLAPGANDTYTIPFPDFGTYGITCADNRGRMLGAVCPVRVSIPSDHRFLWNIWETNDTISQRIGDGLQDTLLLEYRPNVSVINGEDYPNTTEDPIGAVTGSVNDEIYLSIVNAGIMYHTLHFHGYHVEVLQASIRDYMVGWSKDSLPLAPDEAMTIKLVPDKPGVYPVHDHNLISVLTVNIYPGGMITVLNIAP